MRHSLVLLTLVSLGPSGCGWYDALPPKDQSITPGDPVTIEMDLSSDEQGDVWDLDSGILETYWSVGECTRGISNSGWDLQVDRDGVVRINPSQGQAIAAAPAASPESVELEEVHWSAVVDQPFEDLLLMRTDLGAVWALFEPRLDRDRQRITFSASRLRTGVYGPVCSPVSRNFVGAWWVRLDLDRGWVVDPAAALCGTPLDPPEEPFVYDLAYGVEGLEAEAGQIAGPGETQDSYVIQDPEGNRFELEFTLGADERVERIDYRLLEGADR